MAKGNVILTGQIHIPLDEQLHLLPLLEQHKTLSRAEPGCLHFETVQDGGNPSVFNVSERFVDETAFAYHQDRGGKSAWGQAARHLLRHFDKAVI